MNQQPDLIPEKALIGTLLWADEKQKTRLAGAKAAIGGWGVLGVQQHRTILEALERVLTRADQCDLVMLHGELSATGNLTASGGADRLSELIEGCPNPESWESYAKDLLRLSARRKALDLARQVQEKIVRGEELNGELEELSLQQLESTEVFKGEESKKYVPKTIEEVRQMGADLPHVEPTEPCFPEFSKQLSGGYRPGWVVIVGAFTGGGKTTCSVRETVHKAFCGNPALYISCELAAVEVQQKIDMAASEDGFKIPPLPIWIEDRFSALGDICKVIEQWTAAHSEGKTPVVVLDYLQRVRSGAQSNREREVAIVAEELQQLARRLGIILVAAAQLNRNSVSESTTGPQLHHLRESGLIEQIADVAFLINKTEINRLKVFLAKNRWGPAGDEVEYAVDFPNCKMGPLSTVEKLEPIADRVVEYLQGCKDRKAKPREVSMAIKMNGRHPSTAEILDAGRYSKKYALKEGVIGLFGGLES